MTELLKRRQFFLALGLICLCLGLAGAQESEERVFVLVVGVEDYSDPKITDLRYAEDDAQAVYDFFAKDPHSPTVAGRVKLLRGKAATQRGVRLAIRDHLIRQATGPLDTAIFYFAGHGFADAFGVYLGTVDTKLVELELSGLAWSDLQRDWSRISAGRRVFIADACHSGGLEGLRGPGGIGKRVLAIQPKTGSVSVTVAATGANQLSSEDAKSGHGVFTASLLKGLRGGADSDRDGAVSLGELAKHLERDVPRRAKAAGGNQTPEVRYVGDAELGRQLRLSRGTDLPKSSDSAKSPDSERRALQAEIENAELRLKLARLKGELAEAEAAAKEAEAARQRLAGLGGKKEVSGLRVKPIQIRFDPYRVGETHRQKGGFEVKLVLTDEDGKEHTQAISRSYERLFLVKSLRDGEPRGLQTRYVEFKPVVRLDGSVQPVTPLKIEGETLNTMSSLDPKLKLKHAGEDLEPLKDSLVLEELNLATRQLLSWPIPARLVARNEIQPGKELVVTGAEIQPLLELPNDEGTTTRVRRFSYQGTRDQAGQEVAVFKLELLVGPANEKALPVEMTLRGELSVFVLGGRLASIDLRGPIVIGESKELGHAARSGTLRLRRTSEIRYTK